MIKCKNTRCRHCSIDVAHGRALVCTTEPALIKVPESRVFILKCNTYLKRDPGRFIEPLLPCDEDGLFPGQCRPPVDYSNIDPGDIVEKAPPVPISLLEMETENRELQKYVSAEPECDT